jgi:hypothetical protein
LVLISRKIGRITEKRHFSHRHKEAILSGVDVLLTRNFISLTNYS